LFFWRCFSLASLLDGVVWSKKIIRHRKSMIGSDLLRMVSPVLGTQVGVLVQLAGLARQVKAGSFAPRF
jgi:hypothetical protein